VGVFEAPRKKFCKRRKEARWLAPPEQKLLTIGVQKNEGRGTQKKKKERYGKSSGISKSGHLDNIPHAISS